MSRGFGGKRASLIRPAMSSVSTMPGKTVLILPGESDRNNSNPFSPLNMAPS